MPIMAVWKCTDNQWKCTDLNPKTTKKAEAPSNKGLDDLGKQTRGFATQFCCYGLIEGTDDWLQDKKYLWLKGC